MFTGFKFDTMKNFSEKDFNIGKKMYNDMNLKIKKILDEYVDYII